MRTLSQLVCLGVVVGLGSIHTAAAAALPTTHSYRLNGHLVHAPVGVAPQVSAKTPPTAATVFVTATQTSLLAALSAADWQPHAHHVAAAAQERPGVAPSPTSSAAAAAPGLGNTPASARPWVFAKRPGLPGHEVDGHGRIWAWAVGPNPDGPGEIWYVRLSHPPVAGLEGTPGPDRAVLRHAESDLTLKAIFLTGTSRLAVALPVARRQRPLTWIRLRHASTELRLASVSAVDTDADANAGADVSNAAQGREGAPTVASMADVDAQLGHDVDALPMYAPQPESGPACAAHDALPVYPLPADKIASSVVWHAAASKKQVALTFDACSTFAIGRFNPRVLAALRAENVPATLFVGGHWAEMYPQVLEDVAQDPLFELGNHTYSHPHMRDLSPAEQRQELLWTQQLIFERTGKVARLFRPPYGEVDDQLINSAAAAGLYTIEYDLPAGDADDHVTKAHLTNWVVGRSNPGSIVIMHMCRPNNHTADALPDIVRKLRAQGYTFCQVSDMLFHGGAGCR